MAFTRHGAALKRERQLHSQIRAVKKQYGWFSDEGRMAQTRYREFKRLRKMAFGDGYIGWKTSWGDTFATRYQRIPKDWQLWGNWFRQDWP